MKAKLEELIAKGQDAPMVRFTLAKRYLEDGDTAKAIHHAQVAVELDADYSAGWRLLGQAQAAAGKFADAAESFKRGIGVASKRGDRQVAKEMQVFLKRLEKEI